MFDFFDFFDLFTLRFWSQLPECLPALLPAIMILPCIPALSLEYLCFLLLPMWCSTVLTDSLSRSLQFGCCSEI